MQLRLIRNEAAVSKSLLDLLILSVAARKKIAQTSIISVVKDIAGEYWTPTSDVLHEAIEGLIDKRCLEIQYSSVNGENLQITKIGFDEFSILLRRLPDGDTENRYTRLLEIVRLRSLDLLPAPEAGIVIEQMLQRAHSLIEKLEQQERIPDPEGRFMDVWLNADKQDLANRTNILSEIAKNNLLTIKICREERRPF